LVKCEAERRRYCKLASYWTLPTPGPFNLCHDLEPNLDLEKKTEFKVLHGLSYKIGQRDNVVYKERVLERAARRAERQPNTPEDSRAHEVLDRALNTWLLR